MKYHVLHRNFKMVTVSDFDDLGAMHSLLVLLRRLATVLLKFDTYSFCPCVSSGRGGQEIVKHGIRECQETVL